MGIEVSPQGIVTALIVFAVAALAFVNRKSLAGLLPKADPEKHAGGVTGFNVPRGMPINLGPDESFEVIPIHVLDVMKVLTSINERDQLGCEEELTAMYAKIVTHKSGPALDPKV